MPTEPTITVRPRKPGDLPDLAQVLIKVHALDGYPVEGVDNPQPWLAPPRELAAWTALLGSEPIGQVSLTEATPDDDAARLMVAQSPCQFEDLAIPVRLFIDPAHRQHGAGRQLMLAAYEHAASLGRRIVFDVMLKDQAAIRLYEGLGCERLGIITHHHSGGLEEPAAVYVAPAGPLPGAAHE
jgi:GNAT superfamily N-acetyltransferase